MRGRRRDRGGLEPFGYRALDVAADGEGLSLLRDGHDACSTRRSRRASGRSFGSAKGRFVGRDALEAARERAEGRAGAAPADRRSPARTATYLPVYGGEAVRVERRGRRSAAQRGLRPDRRGDHRLCLPGQDRAARHVARARCLRCRASRVGCRTTRASIRVATGWPVRAGRPVADTPAVPVLRRRPRLHGV